MCIFFRVIHGTVSFFGNEIWKLIKNIFISSQNYELFAIVRDYLECGYLLHPQLDIVTA